MNPVFQAAIDLQAFCREQEWRFCLIGGLVVGRWAEARLTADADLTLMTGWGAEEMFADKLLARFTPRRSNERVLAVRTRVAFLRHDNGVKLDVAFGAIPFEERCVARATPWRRAPGVELLTCSAEDLIVHKAFAARHRDWGDIESIVGTQRAKLDTRQILDELGPLVELQERPETIEQLTKIFRRFGLKV